MKSIFGEDQTWKAERPVAEPKAVAFFNSQLGKFLRRRKVVCHKELRTPSHIDLQPKIANWRAGDANLTKSRITGMYFYFTHLAIAKWPRTQSVIRLLDHAFLWRK